MALLRLDKFLSECGVGTRSTVKDFIKKGLVTVDGTAVRRPETKVDPLQAEVAVSGKTVCYEKYVYYVLHKPAGVVSATKDNTCRTVMDLLKKEGRDDLFPVGRLDKDTEGLLILTNDGQLSHDLLSPRKHVAKTYYARLDKPADEHTVHAFREGVDIGDEKRTLPAELTILPDTGGTETELTIQEGRFHQVKRMFESCGIHVEYLRRIRMGGLLLPQDLEKGTYRRLTDDELVQLTENKER